MRVSAKPLAQRLFLAALMTMQLFTGLTVGADQRIASIVAHDSNIAAFARLREDFLLIATNEFGFPPEAIEAWQKAVNEALDTDTMTEDYTAVLAQGLAPDVIDVVIDFNRSDLRKQRDPISDALLSLELSDANIRSLLEQEVAGLPAELNRTAVHLFERYRAPETAHALVEGYLRAMYIAAAPYAGVESAQLWVDEAREAGFADLYVENTFLVFAATLGRYPADRRAAYIEAVSRPEYIAYEQQASIGFEGAYKAAIDRLARAFDAEVSRGTPP